MLEKKPHTGGHALLRLSQGTVLKAEVVQGAKERKQPEDQGEDTTGRPGGGRTLPEYQGEDTTRRPGVRHYWKMGRGRVY